MALGTLMMKSLRRTNVHSFPGRRLLLSSPASVECWTLRVNNGIITGISWSQESHGHDAYNQDGSMIGLSDTPSHLLCAALQLGSLEARPADGLTEPVVARTRCARTSYAAPPVAHPKAKTYLHPQLFCIKLPFTLPRTRSPPLPGATRPRVWQGWLGLKRAPR